MTQPTIKEKTSYCDSVPCTIHDHSDWLDRVKNYHHSQPSVSALEQFNEEVMREFQDEFKQMFEDLSEDKELYFKHVFNNFITQKLTEHKELILMEVKERSYARLKNVDALDWDRFEDILDEIKY